MFVFVARLVHDIWIHLFVFFFLLLLLLVFASSLLAKFAPIS